MDLRLTPSAPPAPSEDTALLATEYPRPATGSVGKIYWDMATGIPKTLLVRDN
jgi:hypothetical protein